MWDDRPQFDIPRLTRLSQDYLINLERMKTPEIEFYRINLSELSVSKEERKIQ